MYNTRQRHLDVAHFEPLVAIAESALDADAFRPLGETLNHICDYVQSQLTCLTVNIRVKEGSTRLVLGGSTRAESISEYDVVQGLGDETLSISIPGRRDPSVEVVTTGVPRYVLTSEFDPKSDSYRRLSATGIQAMYVHPIVRQGAAIGVLDAYWPDDHDLSEQEVGLVALMSRLAAIAIATATFAASRDELRSRLEAASEKLRNENSHLHRIHLAQSRMIQILGEGSSLVLEQLARTMSSALERSVLISDAEGHELALAPTTEAAVRTLRDVAAADTAGIARTDEDGDHADPGESYTLVGLNPPSGSTRLGSVVLCPAIDHDDELAHVMTRQAVLVIAAHLHERRADSSLSAAVLPSALLAISRGLYNASQLKEAAAQFGVTREAPLCVGLVTTPTPEAAVRLSRARGVFEAAGWPLLSSVADGSAVLVLVRGRPIEAQAARTLMINQPQIESIGFSAAVRGLAEVPRGMQEARVAERLAASGGKIAFYDVLGDFADVTGTMTVDQMLSFVSSVLGPVQDYDTQRGTQLLETLRCFIEHDGRTPETAAALQIHVNTLHKRLDRVEQLARVDLRAFRDVARVTLALDLMPTLVDLAAGTTGRGA